MNSCEVNKLFRVSCEQLLNRTEKGVIIFGKKKPVEEEVSDAVVHCARMFTDQAEEAGRTAA